MGVDMKEAISTLRRGANDENLNNIFTVACRRAKIVNYIQTAIALVSTLNAALCKATTPSSACAEASNHSGHSPANTLRVVEGVGGMASAAGGAGTEIGDGGATADGDRGKADTLALHRNRQKKDVML